MSKPKEITNDQIIEITNYLKHWSRRSILKHGFWFKLINDDQVEIINEAETTVWLYNLHERSE